MAFLSGANNSVLVDNCQNLFNLTVQLQVIGGLGHSRGYWILVAVELLPADRGDHPERDARDRPSRGSRRPALSWFQYVLIVANNEITFEIQYWAFSAHSFQNAGPGGNPPAMWWPPGYTANPANTSPWLPVFPNVAVTGTVVGSTSPRTRCPLAR